jgi:hypothetical protein
MKTFAFNPAWAAYAAKDAPAFPDESSIAASTPLECKKLTRRALPLSLNEPDGLRNSHLYATRILPACPHTRGVEPSPREITGAVSGKPKAWR